MYDKVYNGRETDKILIYKISENEYVTPGPLPGVLIEPNKTIRIAKTEAEAVTFAGELWQRHRIRCVIVVERDDQGCFIKPDNTKRSAEALMDY